MKNNLENWSEAFHSHENLCDLEKEKKSNSRSNLTDVKLQLTWFDFLNLVLNHSFF